jgi:hypothetical protein
VLAVRAVPILAALVALSTVVRSWAALRVPSPWIAGDEMIYAELGRSLWEDGRLEILGRDVPFYSLVHPALIGLPLALSTDVGYDAARILQALAMSLTAVPVFLWGRRLMSERWALVAVALTLTLPALAYSGLLMTETVFLPVMTLAAWTAAEALARPTWQSHALLFGAFLLAVLTRLQALVLVPAFVLALLLYAALTRGGRSIRRAAIAAAALAVAGGAFLLVGGMGAYAPAGSADYDLTRATRFVAYHVADMLLLVGLAPACALVLLTLRATRDERADVRAFVAVAIAVSAGLAAQVGVFASRWVGRLAERDLIAVAPLLFLALCLWLDRGAPRTRLVGSAVALVGAAAVVLLPFGRLVHKGALQDAFMLVPLWELGSYDLAVGATVAAVVLLFVLYPRALPVALAVLFVAVSVEASRFVAREAQTLRTSFFADDPSWLDTTASGDVGYLYDGEPHWNAVWAHVFWNRRIRDVYVLPQARVPGPLPQRPVEPTADGSLGIADAPRYVVASTALTLFGDAVLIMAQQGLLQRGLVLWDVEPPLRLSTTLTGVQGSGDIHGPAQLIAYGCDRGALQLTLVAKGAPVSVELTRGDQPFQTLQLAAEQVWNGEVPAAPVNGVCSFGVNPSGLVGSTRFQFARG